MSEEPADSAAPAPTPSPTPEERLREAPKEDPWERRERERQRWSQSRRKGSSRSASASASASDTDPLTADDLNLRENYLAVGLLTAVVLLFVGEVTSVDAAIRPLLTQIGTGLILLLLATCRGFLEDMRVALRRGPNPFLLMLFLWSGFCLFIAPYKAFAVGEMLRIVAGIGAYFLAAYTLKAPRQTAAAVAGLLLFGVVVALWDMTSVGQRGGINRSLTTDYSAIGTHENIGSLLVILLPVALAFAFNTEIEEKRRLAAMAASLVLGAALLVARTRSAWLGGLLALVTLAVLFLRYGPRSEERNTPLWKQFLVSPAAIIALGFLLFLTVAGVGPALLKRASLAGALEDSSLHTRILMWNGAALMALEKPLTGWGLGSYYVIQGLYTHLGDDVIQVINRGVTHENIAHNYYLQWAVDAGLPGLVLHIAAIAAFLAVGYRGLKETRSPFVGALLIGVVAMVCGSLVDAVASPAYNFHGVSTIYWTCLGLAVGALRTPVSGRRISESQPTMALAPLRKRGYLGALALGLVAAGGVLLWGYLIVLRGQQVPRGTLQIVASPEGPARKGTTISWIALYTEGNLATGDVTYQPTMPGVRWELFASPEIMRRAQVEVVDLVPQADGSDEAQIPGEKGQGERRFSVFRALIPDTGGGVQRVRVEATYRDRYGRSYTASILKTVR